MPGRLASNGSRPTRTIRPIRRLHEGCTKAGSGWRQWRPPACERALPALLGASWRTSCSATKPPSPKGKRHIYRGKQSQRPQKATGAMARAQNGLSPEELHRHACDDAASSTGPARICRSEVSVAHKEWKGALFLPQHQPVANRSVSQRDDLPFLDPFLDRGKKKKQDFESARQDGLHAPCSCNPCTCCLPAPPSSSPAPSAPGVPAEYSCGAAQLVPGLTAAIIIRPYWCSGCALPQRVAFAA